MTLEPQIENRLGRHAVAFRQSVMRSGSVAVLGRVGFALMLSTAASNIAHSAPVLPTGGTVASGTATITSPSSSVLTINQTSSKAIINWSSFSIGQGGAVQINNGSGATLDRVTGATVSSIAGRLSATGSVYLINPNGVIIGKTGAVQTEGTFVASTLGLTDGNFLSGRDLQFSGSSGAAVINEGKVGSLGGDVVLVGAVVNNSGAITAANGDIGLTSGYAVTLRDNLLDDGKFAVLVGGSGTSATNSGAVRAAEVELRVNGGNVYALAGNTNSVIEATGVSVDDGKVLLVADNGSTVAHGQVDATSLVETSGATVDFTGLKVKAKSWLIDPADLTVDAAAASTISADLATASITLQTTGSGASGPGVVNASGVGDITIAAPISWGSANTLTLDAYHGINIDAPITVAGAGKVVLTTNDGGTGGDYGFDLTNSGFSGSLSFTGTPGSGQALTINGSVYTLLYKLTDSTAAGGNGSDTGTDDIAGIDNAGDGGDYALAVDVSGNGNPSQFTSTLVGKANPSTDYFANPFTGVFTGLGHTITNLNINDSTDPYVALFGENTGTIRDMGLVGGNITGSGSQLGIVAGLVDENYSTGPLALVENVYSTGNVTGTGTQATTAGLIGSNDAQRGPATVNNAFTTGVITGGTVDTTSAPITAGLVGGAEAYDSPSFAPTGNATVSNSHSSATVIGALGDVSGLVGYMSSGGNYYALLTNDYATGAVTGVDATNVGGLVAVNSGLGFAPPNIVNSYATGNVTGGARANVGGLIGANFQSISNDYATGSVTGGVGASVGGLIGMNETAPPDDYTPTVTVSNVYATGAISASNGNAGGLIGWNYVFTVGTGVLTDSYATGSVSNGGPAAYSGGLIGYEDGLGHASTVVYSYATGAVSDMGLGGSLGGLVGGVSSNEATTLIAQVYSTGQVSGSGSATPGGLIGSIAPGGSSVTVYNAYWDTLTSGETADAAHAYGSGTVNGYDPGTGSIGLTTAQLQSNAEPLPGGHFGGGINGLYPFLLSFYPNGAQAISGFGSVVNGSTVAGANVTIYQNGAPITDEDTVTGANGYFYFIAPNGSFTPGVTLGATIKLSGDATVSGVVYNDQPTFPTGAFSNFNIYSQGVSETTGQSNLSSLNSGMAATFGAAYSSIMSAIPRPSVSLFATNPSGFAVDQNLSSAWLNIYGLSGLTLASGVQIDADGANNAIVLVSGAVFTNEAGASVLDASSGRWLIYSQNPTADTLDGLTPDFTLYGTPYAPGSAPMAGGNGLIYAH